MGALTIAFDTTIVGALALPWVILVVHLVFYKDETGFSAVLDAMKGRLLDWLKAKEVPNVAAEGQANEVSKVKSKPLVKPKQLTVIAGLLLFIIAYTLGSVVSRMARDFFNDDDLHLSDARLRLPYPEHFIVRVGATEDRLLARAYCENRDYFPSESNTALEKAICDFKKSRPSCRQSMNWVVRLTNDQLEADEKLNDSAEDVFGFEEAALLLNGDDGTLRLRQLHDQVMVLRGAAFNGVIIFSLSLFAWGATLRRGPKTRWERRAHAILPALPVLYVVAGLLSGYHHFGPRHGIQGFPSDPPYMEYTLILLGAIGAKLAWGTSCLLQSDEELAKLPNASAHKKKKYYSQRWLWLRLTMLSFILTCGTFLGWWATQVAYAQEVIYSYSSKSTITASDQCTSPQALSKPIFSNKNSPSIDVPDH